MRFAKKLQVVTELGPSETFRVKSSFSFEDSLCHFTEDPVEELCRTQRWIQEILDNFDKELRSAGRKLLNQKRSN
jgi:hypothetical protein